VLDIYAEDYFLLSTNQTGSDHLALKISQKVLILVTVPVLFEIGLVTYVTNLFNQIETSRLKAVHARELTRAHLNSIINSHVQRVSLLILRKMKEQPRESDAEVSPKEKDQKRDCRTEHSKQHQLPLNKPSGNELTKLFAEIDTALDEASSCLYQVAMS
jgi:hypothetical protein